MSFQRFYAVFVARNIEFVRDRGALAWSFIFPLFMILGFAFVFNGQKPLYSVGLLGQSEASVQELLRLDEQLVDVVEVSEVADAQRRLGRHALDLLVDPQAQHYWVNPLSAEGQVLEQLMIGAGSVQGWQRTQVSGEALRYVDWALPGVLSMNMMFAALFGIGYVIVRYRKTGMLKRMMATPVTAVEFLAAQLASRLLVMIAINILLLTGLWFVVDFRLEGNPLLLALVFILGATSLIAIGLLVAARIANEELANGLLNAATWPMMMLSEVWFSMENAAPWLQKLSLVFPLTHMTKAARAVMLDGAGFVQILPHLLYLALVAVVFLVLGARLFRWE
ncbi:MAG: ABC transporter permease [Granulosicoccaceae bacterium]